MPKPTFHNLPAAKRERIVKLAIEEFAGQPFAEASLSRIVANAKIAKGSMYQYFDGKLDLYRWLLTEEVPRRKLAAMQRQTAALQTGDLGAWLRTLVLAGVRFMLDNPRLAELASAVAMPTTNPELQALYFEVRSGGIDGFTSMLAAARDRGQIRDDVDLEVVARLTSVVLTQGLREVALGRLGVDMQQLFSHPGAADALADADLERVVAETVELVLHGIAP